MSAIDNLPTYEELICDTEPYCVDYDFDPFTTTMDVLSWTHKDKWYCSRLAMKDMQTLMFAN